MQEGYIRSLDVGERDLYAEMVMRSLRGSWTSPRRRAKILKTICDVGGLLVYDAESLKSSVEQYLKRGEENNHWDGRHFRHIYGEVDVTDFPKHRVSDLASHIPDDLTWDERTIKRRFED